MEISQTAMPTPGGHPVRTCVGCRQRADKTELVRVVAADGGTAVAVVLDLRGSAPGRGAYLHPTIQCLERATQRRAFGPALRVHRDVDLARINDLVRGPERAREADDPERWSTRS